MVDKRIIMEQLLSQLALLSINYITTIQSMRDTGRSAMTGKNIRFSQFAEFFWTSKNCQFITTFDHN